MKKSYRIVAPSGLNARLASLMVGVFNRFNGTVKVFYNDNEADGKSILSLITLVVKSNEQIIVEAEGKDVVGLFDQLNKVIQNQSPIPLIEIEV